MLGGPSAVPLSVSHVWLEVEQAKEVCGGCIGDFIWCDIEETRQDLSRLRYERRLIALAALGSGGEPWRIRFNEDTVERHAGGNIAERLRLGIGEIAGERDQEAKVQRAASLFPTTAKAVHDPAKSGWPPMFIQNHKEIVPGVSGLVSASAMDQDRPLARRGNLKLADEASALRVSRSALMIVVKADFATGDDLRLGE